MIETSLARIAEVTGGRLDGGADGAAVVRGSVEIDSRLVGPGSLFVAMVGERVDGHDYAAAAVRGGAVGVLAERPVGQPAVVVRSAVDALGDLAHDVVSRAPGLSVVAVTGSSGKTSTKDLLAAVLARRGPVVAPPGSLNNEIGLPLTALRVDLRTATLVVEMGARGIGHISRLCAVTPPDVGVVLNVGTAHVGEFGSRDVVATAKAELVEALRPGGTAVLNGDDPLVAAMAGRTAARVLRFGEGDGCDVRATDVRLDDAARALFTVHLPDGRADVALALHGRHHVANALGAAAVAHVLGLRVAEIAEALSAATASSRWRMEVVRRSDGLVVVNDAYNANPESTRAAVEALVALGAGRRTWAVLGEMRELGRLSATEHEAVGRLAVRLGVDRLVAVGPGARPVHEAAVDAGATTEEPGQPPGSERPAGERAAGPATTVSAWVPDPAAAADLLRAAVTPEDVVLVKASRSIGLERVAEALLAGQPDRGAAT